MENIIIKKSDINVAKELNLISFDSSYIDKAVNKYKGESYKLFGLKPHEANILKQICLSLGFDCAVSRDTVMCNCEKTDALIFATYSQISNLIPKLRNQPFRLKQIASELDKIINSKIEPLIINDFVFDWERPYIMGIVNVTPDSFSDGGKYSDTDLAYKHALKLIEDGADIIDIGGESTNPNSMIVSDDIEMERVIPLVKKLRENNINVPISVDTRHYSVAKEAVDNGADIINDVSFGTDRNLLDFVNDNNIPYILMHSDKIPASSEDSFNGDIVDNIYISMYKKLSEIKTKNVIIDVGIGFGKSKESCFELVRRMSEFKTLNKPILSAISRKSFITKQYNISSEDADLPTAIYTAFLAKQGIQIHRVHNVKLVKQYLNYTEII